MIAEHQPTNLPDGLVAGLSSIDDGDMKYGTHNRPTEVLVSRQKFLKKLGINIDQTNLVMIDYNSDNFCRYRVADVADDGVSLRPDYQTRPADAIATDQCGQALFLPIADCCPLILADSHGPVFMLSHLGRHSVSQQGAARSVQFLEDNYKLKPGTLKAWLGPAVGKASYPLHGFDGRSLQEIILEQLLAAGLFKEDVEICQVDTATDERYFSHSQFQKGHRTNSGRFAVAVMRQN